MSSEEYPKIADYFVVAGLTETSAPLEEDLAFPNAKHKLSDQKKDPITDISVIDKTLEEPCPQGFTCIEQTPTGFFADLNHGSLTAHNLLLCYRRGKDKPPLIDLGVFYEGLETVRSGITILENTPAGRSANVNNKSGMGSHPIYLTYRRAKESAPQNALVVTDICIILTNKGEKAPYAFCQIQKNLNKGLIGSSVHLCYKKSMRQVDSLPFKAGFLGRYPAEDVGAFNLPATVPLFCLPMGATIECWSSKTRHPLPTFSSFVLTTETSEKVFGAVVSFYESYPEEKLTDEQRFKLGLLRGDGQRSRTVKTVHTNKAICLLSRWPMFSAFRDFLMYLYRLTVSPIAHPIPVERHIAHFMHNVPFPTSQRPRVQYQMSPMHTTIFTRPQITPIPLSGASFLALLDDLGPENTITLLVLALTEHKIVIHSLRPAEITCVAEALITLLFPFKWQCTYVPLCPLEMGYVLEAPCPFIVGVDSRYFDLYEPPPDVACVNLDTNSVTVLEEKINWKVLPRKPAKLLKSVLQKYFKEVKECPREESTGGGPGSMLDPDMARTERHRRLELAIQEAVLKLMCGIMKGYRQFLLPITESPTVGTTDPSSLFNIQEFIRSRERSSQRFFQSLSGTQLFSSFVEERSLTSFGGGESDLSAGRASGLVFFDECIDRLAPEHASESARLIEPDDSLKSEHTVMIMPPDEFGLPAGVGYQYTTFPELQDELFSLGEDDVTTDQRTGSLSRPRRKSDSFAFGRRTKQEVRTLQKISRLHNGDPNLWARLILSHTYGAWFACLPAFVQGCRHKSAALRTAHDALHSLKDKECLPLPDETYYRVLLHLCAVHNKPALAVRVFQFVRKSGVQLSAITYGLYNKAVLEGTWPASNRDGYMLWQKLRNVFLATQKFRYVLRRRYSAVGSSEASSDFDSTSVDSSTPQSSSNGGNSPEKQPPLTSSQQRHQSLSGAPTATVADGATSKAQGSAVSVGDKSKQLNCQAPLVDPLNEVECGSTGGQSDHGYNSMPKDLVRRGSPQKATGKQQQQAQAAHLHVDALETKSCSTGASGSLASLPESAEEQGAGGPAPYSHPSPPEHRPVTLERTESGRSVEPPSTLDIPARSGEGITAVTDPGLKSDETLVNGESGDAPAFFPSLPEQEKKDPSNAATNGEGESNGGGGVPHRPRSSPVSPAIHRKPGRSSSIVKSGSSGVGGGSGAPGSDIPDCDPYLLSSSCSGVETNTNTAALAHATSPNHDVITPATSSARDVTPATSPAVGERASMRPFRRSNAPPPLVRVTPALECPPSTPPSSLQSSRALPQLLLKGSSPTNVTSPNRIETDNDVFAEESQMDGAHVTGDDKVDHASPAEHHLSPSGSCCKDGPPSASPGTPEIANLFGGDSKFVSSLSDSDQKRYQELCSHRPSSLDPDHLDARKTRHGSLLLHKNARGRTGSGLFAGGGGISPLIGQKSFSELGGGFGATGSPVSPAARNNFDNMTAEDIASPSGSPRHTLGSRSPSGSILKSVQSPSRLLATSNSPKYRRRNPANKLAGSNSLVVVDGVAMLTSTPMRPIPEPKNRSYQDDVTPAGSLTSDGGQRSSLVSKRQDISHLEADPLSPSYDDPLQLADDLEDALPLKDDNDTQSNNVSRHLVDEIEDYLQRDSLIRSASDATTLAQQRARIAKSSTEKLNESGGKTALDRKASLPSVSPNMERKNQQSNSLTRSFTLDGTSSWFSSGGSKFNNLLKATTVGMATKAKKVASDLAKDLNDTVKASVAYYTPEKLKDSLSDLSFRGSQDDVTNLAPAARRQHLLGVKGVEQYSSQTSLKSSESIHSALDVRTGSDKVQRRSGAAKRQRKLDRPLSMPQVDLASSSGSKAPLANSYLSVPGDTSISPDPNITASMLSLNAKDNSDVVVTISSCSKCHKCGSLVYDEEIMAGWIADESNLNTHCPFCNSLFVPFLNIEITDYRSSHQRSSSISSHSRPVTSPPASARSQHVIGVAMATTTTKPESFAADFLLPLTPDVTQSDNDVTQSDADVTGTHNDVAKGKGSVNPLTPPPTPAIADDVWTSPTEVEQVNGPLSPKAEDVQTSIGQTVDAHSVSIEDVSQGSTSNLSDNLSSAESQSAGIGASQMPRNLEPVTVPYLSSLVLRKELESLLENEGTRVLVEAGFVDHHPIIYWNLVWYFRRLNLHSNLYSLLLRSQLLRSTEPGSPVTQLHQQQLNKGTVAFHLMWDNVKLHGDNEKSPMYFVYHQLASQGTPDGFQSYSLSFLENIRESIMQDDVLSPLVAVLNELNAQSGTRRSAYREILYMVIIALGKESIDVAAFDREYIRAFESLSPAEKALTRKCDRPPSEHTASCRNIFGELDLYK